MDHRLELISFWNIAPGSRVLELGCGQGECTVALADAVGPEGHIDAVDPGSPEYGAPYTLSQSQSHLSAGPLGPRITWHLQVDPLTYLKGLEEGTKYDYVVLSHCIWYFESPALLAALLTALAPHTRTLCLAEWSLRACTAATLPHVITALLLASLESKRKIPSHGNVRTVLSPAQITKEVLGAGFKKVQEETKASNEGLLDGYWEASYALKTREKVLGALKEEGVSEKELGALVAMYDSVEQGVGLLEDGAKGVKAMDYWAGIFESS